MHRGITRTIGSTLNDVGSILNSILLTMIRSRRIFLDHPHRPFEPPKERVIPPALGPLLETKTVKDIENEGPSDHIEVEDCELIASYNLLEGLQKTILVPGRPPAWTPLAPHSRLRPDSGNYYRDENAARFPEHPMEPAVKSIFHLTPSFDSSKIEVFACGSTLGDLLRYSLGRAQPFSFTVHVLGSTAFFLRRNNSPIELIEDVKGFGHSFPEANTTWGPDVVGSSSHNRIIQYTVGGLRLLVRFEGDGYTLDDADDLEEEEMKPQRNNEDLMTKAASWNIDSKSSALKAPEDDAATHSKVPEPLSIRSQGRLIPQSSVFDLKTRSSRKPKDEVMAEQIPRLWVRQIRKFILAFHSKGDFDTAEVLDVGNLLGDWERKSALALQTFTKLVHEIRDAALAAPEKKIEVRGVDASTLELRGLDESERQKWNALPDELEAKWRN